jgi:hypothetical protein
MPKSSIRNTYETNGILPSSRTNNLFRCNTYKKLGVVPAMVSQTSSQNPFRLRHFPPHQFDF